MEDFSKVTTHKNILNI